MKILGFEVTRHAQTAMEPSPVQTVSIEKNLQQTEPSKPLKSSSPRAVLGDSGTRMLHGIITEEYNPQLQGIEGIKVYDEMRKSDGTVRAALMVCTLPIRRAHWFVNPASDDPKDVEIAQFVEHALFDWLDLSWDDVIRQALLMVTFGVMVFEKVYGVREHDGTKYVTLEKLAPRLPKSILQWELVDRTFGIQQIRQDGVLAQIPGSKLVIFCNEREGDNWWGTPMIRAAYQHWYRKKMFYAIDAVAFERQGLGIPVITMPPGYTEADEKQAETVLKNLRASESAYLVLPPEYTFEFANMGASTVRDPEKSIEHHSKQILQSVLAQFLELGVTRGGSGSRALATDHSDLFLKAMESIANTIIDAVNTQLIRELVDLNFNDVKVYPVLDYGGITKVDIAALGTAYAQMVTAGALTPTDDDQQYIRAALGLPPRTQEQIEEEENGEPNTETQEDHVDIEETGPEESDTATETGDVNKSADAAQVEKDKKQPGTKPNIAKKKTTASEKSVSGAFESWRPLTFAEKKVDWTKVQTTMDTMEKQFTVEAQAQLTKAKDALMVKVQDALKRKDTNAVADLGLQFQNAYTDLLKSAMKKAYTYGKNTASSEMNISPQSNSIESIATINTLADTIAKKTFIDIETRAKVSIVNALKQSTNAVQAAGTIDSTLEQVIQKTVDNTSAMLVGQNINAGRNDVFKRNTSMIQSLQRSELLDAKTCNFCLSVDGLVIDPTDSWASIDTYHSNCRGIWVEIMNDEQDAPPITGIPPAVKDLYGGETNALQQPKTPITRPGTLADRYVKKRDAAIAAKKK